MESLPFGGEEMPTIPLHEEEMETLARQFAEMEPKIEVPTAPTVSWTISLTFFQLNMYII